MVQPDLHYGGGFIRAANVARMAALAALSVRRAGDGELKEIEAARG